MSTASMNRAMTYSFSPPVASKVRGSLKGMKHVSPDPSKMFTVNVVVATPHPVPGGGLGIEFVSSRAIPASLEDRIVGAARGALLQALAKELGGLPQRGLWVGIHLELPRRMAGSVQRVVSEAVAGFAATSLRLTFTQGRTA